MPADDPGQVGGGPKHRHWHRPARTSLLLSRETGQPQAEFGVAADEAGELGGHRPGADDHRRLGQRAPAVRRPQDLVGGRATAADRDGGQQRQADRRPRRDPPEQAQRGQGRGYGDPACLVGDARGDLQPVLLAGRQHRQNRHGVAGRRSPGRTAERDRRSEREQIRQRQGSARRQPQRSSPRGVGQGGLGQGGRTAAPGSCPQPAPAVPDGGGWFRPEGQRYRYRIRVCGTVPRQDMRNCHQAAFTRAVR